MRSSRLVQEGIPAENRFQPFLGGADKERSGRLIDLDAK
jgi:hypothetical protein